MDKIDQRIDRMQAHNAIRVFQRFLLILSAIFVKPV